MRKLLKDAFICLFIFLVMLLSFVYLDPTYEMGSLEYIDLAYFEDKSGELNFRDVSKISLKDKFIKKENSRIFFGKSTSVFWIRILVKDPRALEDYLAVYSPNVQNLQLHISNEFKHKVSYSGWENNKIKQDMGLIYPVFSLSEYERKDLVNKPIYLRIETDYLHDYAIYFYNQDKLNHMRNIDFCIVFILSGVLFTIFITNIIIFFKIKNKNCLIFALSVLFLAINQGSLTGAFNIIPNQYSSVLMSLAIEMMALFQATIISVFIAFSNIKVLNNKHYNRLLG